MMSTIVYQNLASSCFEYPHTETTITTTLKLKVAPPSAALDLLKKQGTDIDHSANLEFENWGFLQTIPKESGDNYTESKQTNPWVDKKAQFSSLSQESLELCTENLGSETGSDNTITGGGGGGMFPYPSPPFIVPRSEYSTSPTYPNRKAASNYRETKNFPPPLTTMSGGSSLQVRRHREEGRLTVEVVEAPFRNPYLKAERIDGRLRLCFLTAGGEETTSVSAGDEDDDGGGGGGGGGETAEEEEIEEARSEVGSEFREESEFDGEINNLEHELEKFPSLSRCKGGGGGHGNKGLCSSNWKPALWVAIS